MRTADALSPVIEAHRAPSDIGKRLRSMKTEMRGARTERHRLLLAELLLGKMMGFLSTVPWWGFVLVFFVASFLIVGVLAMRAVDEEQVSSESRPD